MANDHLELIIAFALMLCFFGAIIKSCDDNKAFHENGGYNALVRGIVTKKTDRIGSRDKNVVFFEFYYQDELYRGYNSDLKQDLYESVNIRDSITIGINKQNPNFSIIYFH